MKKIKTTLIGLILTALFVCIGMTEIYAATVIKEMTNSDENINYEIIQQEPAIRVKPKDRDSEAIYWEITNNGHYGIYTGQLGRSENIYCIQKDVYFQDAAQYFLQSKHTGAWDDDPKIVWILGSELENSGTRKDYFELPAQKAMWGVLGQENPEEGVIYQTVMEANAYADYAQKRLESQNQTGSDYKYPEVKQTRPQYTNGLAGPYQIDYMFGEYNGEYFVSGISEMILKDENGNIITHSTNDLGNSARWYIANSDGTPLDNGNYGNNPKPNQEFYIKLINFSGKKGYITFKIKKIEINTDYITCIGETVFEDGSFQCEDCAAGCGAWSIVGTKLEGRACSFTNTAPIAITCPVKSSHGTVQKGASCGGTLYYNVNTYGICGESGNLCAICKQKHCGKYIGVGTSTNPKTGVTGTYSKYCRETQGGVVPSQNTIIVDETIITETEINLNFELDLGIGVDLSLRKFITGVNHQDITDRVPQVDTTPIKDKTGTTAIYNHTKEPLKVAVGDLVEYTIRVYNEGGQDAYAAEVTDYLPSNLEFVSSRVGEINYGWKVSNENGKTVLKTSYLQNTVLKAFSDGDNFNNDLDYKDLKVLCRVKDTTPSNEKLTNIAEITKYKNHLGNTVTTDIDSQPANVNLPEKNVDWQGYKDDQIQQAYVPGQQDDDDFEKLILWYTDIGGTVWVDVPEGKQEERDGVLTNKDERFANIDVILYQDGSQIATTKTDSNGTYKFERREVNQNYTVKFAYGGQQYMPVNHVLITNQNYKAENSAGYEILEERQALNAKFFEIVNGTSKLSNGNASIPLKYTKDTNKYTSTLNRDEALWNASIIWATTGEFSGTIKNEAIHNINLGLYERAQINFGILTDVVSVDTTIRGQTQTFNKGQRDAGLAMNVEAKVDDIVNNKTRYNQAIYKSDYNYRIEDYKGLETVPVSEIQKADELEVYVTYKIDINNYSSKPGQITELVHYYTKQYELDKAWYNNGNNQVTINTSAVDSGVSDYNAIYLRDPLGKVTIESNGHMYVYIRYKVNKDENGNIQLGEKYTYTEITGYSSADGLIDINSEPGNMDMKTVDNYVATYEDDTDRAPGINLVLSEDSSRELSGFVFEDMVAGKDAQDVNIGNGNFSQSENDKKIDGVRIQLIELVQAKDNKTYEYIWQEMYTGNGEVSYMDRNGNLQQNKKQVQVGKGEYNFTDILPGKYIVRFIYGDTVRTLNYTGQDFKSTKYVGIGNNTSAAKDNKARRKQVMDYSKTITNEISNILSATTQENPLHTRLLENTWMNADTVETLQINIDTQKYANNVNFGLIRRPKTALTMVKEVTGLKVTHNGIIYVDTANGITTGLKQLPNGNYSLELDDELLNGAVLEATYSVKIVNTGEKDTLYNYFEGDANYGSNQHELITTSADIICDYPENIGFDEEVNKDWTTQNIDTSILSKEAQEKINKDKPLVITTTKLTKALRPGEETGSVTMTTSKIMAAGGDDDMIYSNVAEIVKVTNSAGRRDESSTPGNYIPLSHDTTEPDTDDATVQVTDPTGSKAPQIYYILSITIGAMLITGIVFIKKFVNKK